MEEPSELGLQDLQTMFISCWRLQQKLFAAFSGMMQRMEKQFTGNHASIQILCQVARHKTEILPVFRKGKQQNNTILQVH